MRHINKPSISSPSDITSGNIGLILGLLSRKHVAALSQVTPGTVLRWSSAGCIMKIHKPTYFAAFHAGAPEEISLTPCGKLINHKVFTHISSNLYSPLEIIRFLMVNNANYTHPQLISAAVDEVYYFGNLARDNPNETLPYNVTKNANSQHAKSPEEVAAFMKELVNRINARNLQVRKYVSNLDHFMKEMNKFKQFFEKRKTLT